MRTLDDGTLWIEEIRESDDGVYVCMAENRAGSIKAVGRVTVNSKYHDTWVRIRAKPTFLGLFLKSAI